MILVDSCGWLEYFSNGDKAEEYYNYIKREPREKIVTPTIVIYEIYKKIKKEISEEKALIAVAQIENYSTVTPLKESIAIMAGDISIELHLPMADAIVYATAKANKAKVITSDEHFKDLENVVFI